MADEDRGYTEGLRGQNNANPFHDASTADRDRAIVAEAVKGTPAKDIEARYKISNRQLRRILKDYAAQARAEAVEDVEQAFAIQKARLERLYGLVDQYLQLIEQSFIDKLPLPFDDKVFRMAVLICERQAKLLGFDKEKGAQDRGRGWLADAPIGDVVTYAKQLKMNIPSEFET